VWAQFGVRKRREVSFPAWGGGTTQNLGLEPDGRKRSRAVVAGKLAFNGHTGANTVRFQGRLSKKKKLKPGRYSLTIVAANGDGQRATAKLDFTAVKS